MTKLTSIEQAERIVEALPEELQDEMRARLALPAGITVGARLVSDVGQAIAAIEGMAVILSSNAGISKGLRDLNVTLYRAVDAMDRYLTFLSGDAETRGALTEMTKAGVELTLKLVEEGRPPTHEDFMEVARRTGIALGQEDRLARAARQAIDELEAEKERPEEQSVEDFARELSELSGLGQSQKGRKEELH